jgi:hypothetical protein
MGSGNTATLMAMASYAPSKIVGLSFTIFSNIPMETGSQPTPGSASAPTTGGATPPPSQGVMTLLMPSISVRPVDSLRLTTSLSHMINYGGVDPSFGINGPRTPGGATGGFGNGAGDLFQDTTTITTSANYSVSRNFMLVASLPIGFTSGLLDPTGGFNFLLPIKRDRDGSVTLNGGLQASAPFSARSQEQGKITTLTATLSPSLRYDIATFAFTSQMAYSFYQFPYSQIPSQPAPTTPTTIPGVNPLISSAPEMMRTLNSLNLSFRLSDKVSTFSSASINFMKRTDESISWGTQAVPLGLSYNPGTLSFSGYFSLASDPTDDQVVTFPNQSMIGGSITVRFGSAPPPFPERSTSSRPSPRSPSSELVPFEMDEADDEK